MLKTLYALFLIIIFSASCESQSKPDNNAKTPKLSAKEASSRQVIKTDQAPNPVGPYNQAIKVANTLYLAGQIGLDPESGKMVNSDIEEEARQVMENLKAVLAEADMDMSHVVKSTIYMTDLNNFTRVNEIYAGYFGEDAPARVTVGVASLPKDAQLEISMIAVK
ncbi:RidA family protein [Porifericola rhodea]|uniref:RidA family protein n=1 Tax=Porifericola rhodea TaxID=930972 RepID=UPI0026667C7B|nr:RidA family protein [Porifericola rhodea]WKN33739.1 RidA family protein [Porifericola rhodea]